MSKFITNIGLPPVTEPQMTQNLSGDVDNSTNWVNYHNQVAEQINSAEFYGNPSELLNSDFNFNVAIAAPVTQADGDGAYVSEKWQIHGAAVATYSIAHTAYTATANDPTGSKEYLQVTISNYTGNGSNSDFYLYQQSAGAQFLRQYQHRNLSFSCNINNNQSANITCRFEYYFFYDGSAPVIKRGSNFTLQPGNNEISDTFMTDDLLGKTVGAAPYIQFRFVFCTLNANTADISILYLKYEIADEATVLYVDHPLERTRIDNS